jgi:hypothetical protein
MQLGVKRNGGGTEAGKHEYGTGRWAAPATKKAGNADLP